MPIITLFTQMQANKARPACGKCGARKQLQANRNVFEGCLTRLTEEDKKQIKAVLNTQEVCYYSVDRENKLQLVCF